ncbi:hypothetical protein ACPVPU_00245 [Sphingomonas sp. CJ99]
MRLPARTTLLVSMILSGCVASPSGSPFMVIVRGPADACALEVDGRKIADSHALLAVAREQHRRGRTAIVKGDEQLPYRCVGGAIYTLQSAGYRDVRFETGPAQ